MKLTISQEGSNPITIDTDTNTKNISVSNESGVPAPTPTSTPASANVQPNNGEAYNKMLTICRQMIGYGPTLEKMNDEFWNNQNVENAQKLYNTCNYIINSGHELYQIASTLGNDPTASAAMAGGMAVEIEDANDILNKARELSLRIESSFGSYIKRDANEFSIGKQQEAEALAKQQAEAQARQQAEEQAKQQAHQQRVQTAQNVGLGAAAVAGAAILTKVLGGTIYNKVASIGNFNSGNEMLQSPKIVQMTQAIVQKNGNIPLPTVEEVKADPRAKSKSSFLGWLLGGSSSASVAENAGSYNFLIKSVNNVPVSITSIKPLSFNGSKVLIATAYVRTPSGELKSIPLARGFLNSGNMVNASRECADIYFGKDNKTYTKNDILNMVKSIRSGECGPITLGEAVHVIDDLSL